MYVTNVQGLSVSVIDTNTNIVITTIPFFQPRGIAYDPIHERMYVTNIANGSVSILLIPN